ncbi:hypothetical protein [Hydrogenobacter thermophilus]|uniref:hypothetical protein n=1 Tax=Hydrogenobacter thermophilus TaxID=940 RepID=UPI0002EDE46D|nr:hypothetical protein [Hydrogenobacter thermophilus]
MVVCDTEGRVYDLWFHPGSYHEVKALRLISVSGWRKGITLPALLYGYVIGYSFFRGSYEEVLYHA